MIKQFIKDLGILFLAVLLVGGGSVAFAARTAIIVPAGGNTNGISYFNGTAETNVSTFTFDGANIVNSVSNATLNLGGASLLNTTAFQISSSTNNNIQQVIQNLSAGNNASASLTLNNGSSTASTYYAEVGINGGNFSQGAFTGESKQDMFLLSSDANLDIETASSTGPAAINFLTAGTLTANIRATIASGGNFGIASTSPFGTLSITGNTSTNPFVVSTTTTTNASSTLFMIDKSGDVHLGGGTPVLSSCGTGPTLDANSTDQAGTVTVGSSASTCTLTFFVPKLTKPHCVLGSQTGTLAISWTETTTAIVFTNATLGGDKVDYICALGH